MLIRRVKTISRIDSIPSQFVISLGVALLLGVAALRFTPLRVLEGVFGIASLALITSRPELGLIAIILITGGLIYSERLPLLTLGSISLQVTDIILLYLLALVLIKALVAPNFKLTRTPLDVPLVCFCFAVLVSTMLAISHPSISTQFVLRSMRPLMYYLAFFAVTNLIKSRQQISVLINGLFAVAVLTSLVTLVQVVAPSIHIGVTRSAELVTAGQEFSDVVRTSLLAERLIYLMFFLSLSSLVVGGKWLPPVLEWIRAAILAVGILLAFARNQWLTLIIIFALLAALVSWPSPVPNLCDWP